VDFLTYQTEQFPRKSTMREGKKKGIVAAKETLGLFSLSARQIEKAWLFLECLRLQRTVLL
jgi:hypothetical protein